MNNEEKILSMLEVLVTKVDKLEQGQGKLEQGYSKLEQGLVKLEQGQESTNQRLTRIAENVAKIEYEHGQSLAALHDGYQMLYEITVGMREDISVIKEKQDEHSLHINYLLAERR